MARTSSAKIVGWGEPPAPEPTGWEAITIELGERPGEWANLGDYSQATARKIARERFPESAGYETRTAAGKDGKTAVWVRFTNPAAADAGAVADAPAADADAADDGNPVRPRSVKRGSV